MKKKIFLDLDETLLHASYAGRVDSLRPDADAELDPKLGLMTSTITCGFHGELELYRAVLRKGAVGFIRSLQNEYGKENVYILTRAITDYAQKFSRTFGFGIENENIFARENIHSGKYMQCQEGYHAVLVDNLPGRECEDKTSFLNRSKFSKVSTIEVNDFYGALDNVLSEKLINEIRSI